MRRDGRNDRLDALHDRFEAENGRGVLQAVACAVLHFMRDLGAFDQGFARHAAVVEAVAAHFVGLNQRDFGFHGGGNIGRDQTPRTGANDDQVAVKLLRLQVQPAGVNLALLQDLGDLARQQGKEAEQHERAQQGRAQNAFQ